MPNPSLSRRRLLTAAVGAGGMVALGTALAACGGDDGSDAGGGDVTGFVMVPRYQSDSVATGQVRLPFSIASSDGALLTTGPDTLVGEVRNEQGNLVAQVTLPRRGTGLAVPYWTLDTLIPARGLYDVRFAGQSGDPTPFIVESPDTVRVPVQGDPLPAFDTPTTADARGVDPVCTRLEGPCPFHAVTLTEALAAGLPVVYLIGTPAHCSTGTCAPGLDFLIDVAADYDGRASFVHAEVYADQAATTIAPAVTSLDLTYEPVIWITDAAGIVQRRIDVVWDRDELAEILAGVLG